MKIITALLLLTVISYSLAAYCKGKPNPNHPPNLNAIYSGEPRFIRSVKNGKLYLGGPENSTFYIIHVWGSPYERGLAQGQLMAKEISEFVPALWTHLEEEFLDGPDWLPPPIRDYIAKIGLDVALELEIEATEPYTPSYWYDELYGIAEGVSNPSVTYEDLLRIIMLGELTKATCSMFGAWGDAVSGTSLLQLRSLDWDTDGPFPNFPAVIVYHPDEGHSFANVGWVSWVGSITGMSSNRMAISEIGVYFPDDTWGTESRFGYPFVMLLRDILQYDQSVDDSTNRFKGSSRTCNLLTGVGDGKASEFRGYQYSASVLNVFDDTNLQPLNDTWHPRIKDIVYWGMDWLCPGYDLVFSEQLKKYYGNITVENTIRYIIPSIQSGSTHVALYDLGNNFMYYSFVGPENTPNRAAYDRVYTKLDMAKLFAEQRP